MKRSLFYSFITILLTALCVVSGTTYAYFSSVKENDINIEAAKVDVKLKLTNINLDYLGNNGATLDPLKPNTYNFDYDTEAGEIKTGSLILSDNSFKLENISGLYNKYIYFDFEFISNSNVSIDTTFKEVYNNKTLRDEVNLSVNVFESSWVSIEANNNEPNLLSAHLLLNDIKSNNLEIKYSPYTVISGENRYNNILPSAEEIFKAPENFFGEHEIDIPLGLDEYDEPYILDEIVIGDFFKLSSRNGDYFTKKYFDIYDENYDIIDSVNRTNEPSKIKIEKIDYSSYNINPEDKPFGFRVSVSNLLTNDYSNDDDMKPEFQIKLKPNINISNYVYDEEKYYPIISYAEGYCSYDRDEDNNENISQYNYPTYSTNNYVTNMYISSLYSNKYLTDDINYVPLFEIVYVNQYDKVGAR